MRTSCDVGASWALPRLVGLRRVLEISLLGNALTDADAERLGLVNRVVRAAKLEAQVRALAQRLAGGPTRALGEMRRLMRRSFDRSLPKPASRPSSPNNPHNSRVNDSFCL